MIARLYSRVMKTFTVTKPEEFNKIFPEIFDRAFVSSGAVVVTLTGDLGAGKTTFTQQLAAYLNISETVVSPTFGIMKSYEISENEDFDQLIHIDAYRIEDISETEPLRFTELFKQPRTLICVEWPEQIQPILPEEVISVSITITENEERTVTVE
tara:strand:- start:1334 stop:1798 length:465 start_codon:yes stop_codon:yes gene_type:complete